MGVLLLCLPSPPVGEGGSRHLSRETDERFGSTNSEFSYPTCSTAPSSDASRHLLPQGEKVSKGVRP